MQLQVTIVYLSFYLKKCILLSFITVHCLILRQKVTLPYYWRNDFEWHQSRFLKCFFINYITVRKYFSVLGVLRFMFFFKKKTQMLNKVCQIFFHSQKSWSSLKMNVIGSFSAAACRWNLQQSPLGYEQ